MNIPRHEASQEEHIRIQIIPLPSEPPPLHRTNYKTAKTKQDQDQIDRYVAFPLLNEQNNKHGGKKRRPKTPLPMHL